MNATMNALSPERTEGPRKNKKSYRLGWIGCGARGSGYPMHLRRLGHAFDLMGVVDPRQDQVDLAVSTFGSEKTRQFDGAAQMLNAIGGELDGVIVASPNFCHAEHAVEVLDRGIPLLLEKPVAVNKDQLAKIWAASSNVSHACVIGFTLRYTPFYHRIQALIRGGVLGKVLSIHAEELMSDRLTSLYSRGLWRPDLSISGGLMLEKCCHDMDILSWLVGSRIDKIQSFCRRTFLHPIPGAADTCDVCKLESECRFSYNRIIASFRGLALSEHFDKLASQTTDQRCVYQSGREYPDHQTINLSFDDGMLATFSVAMAQPRNERTISIQGTEARLYGEFERGVITLIHHAGPNDERREEIVIEHDGSGHGGGDTPLVNDFIALMDGDDSSSRASLKDAINASAVCLAADQSCREERVVRFSEYLSAIYND